MGGIYKITKIMNLLVASFGVVYVTVGAIGLFAIIKVMNLWWGVNLFVAFFAALLLTYIPLVGSIFAYYGMVEGWSWDPVLSFILIGFPYFIIIMWGVLFVIGAVMIKLFYKPPY